MKTDYPIIINILIMIALILIIILLIRLIVFLKSISTIIDDKIGDQIKIGLDVEKCYKKADGILKKCESIESIVSRLHHLYDKESNSTHNQRNDEEIYDDNKDSLINHDSQIQTDRKELDEGFYEKPIIKMEEDSGRIEDDSLDRDQTYFLTGKERNPIMGFLPNSIPKLYKADEGELYINNSSSIICIDNKSNFFNYYNSYSSLMEKGISIAYELVDMNGNKIINRSDRKTTYKLESVLEDACVRSGGNNEEYTVTKKGRIQVSILEED